MPPRGRLHFRSHVSSSTVLIGSAKTDACAEPGARVTLATPMEDLFDYLNDHVAGAVAALELLDRLIEAYEGKPQERFFRDLRADIHQDQEQLKELIEKLGAEESTVRKAGAWAV